MINWFKRLIISAINKTDKDIKSIQDIQILHLAAYQDHYRNSLQHDTYELKLSFLRMKKEILKALIGVNYGS